MPLTMSHLAGRPRTLAVVLAAIVSIAVAVLFGASTQTLPSVASSSAPAAPATLADVVRQDPTRQVEVVVQFRDAATFAAGRNMLSDRGATVTRDLHVINGYGATMSAAGAERLLDDARVSHVSLNRAVETSGVVEGTSTSYLESTGLDRLWRGNGVGTGKGVTVAVIDTGIAGDHPDFRTSPTNGESRVIATTATNPGAANDSDSLGHGTHVAGLIAGDGNDRPYGDPLRGKYVGAAPDANLVSVKIADEEGNASLIDVIYGLQFVVDHQDELDIRVVNLSLTSATAESHETDPLDAAVESAWLHGIVVVAAAGNKGTADDAVHYAPGNDPYVISVGGVDTLDTKRISDDTVATWSSRGTTQDGFAKPEVVAPGAHIVGPYAAGSDFGDLCPTCVTDGQYFKIGGTSMSAAIVSGIVAGLLEEHPEWTPDQVKGALVNNLRKISGGTRGEVDAEKANRANGRDLVSNVGLTPNELLEADGDIDYTRASWSRASWSKVEGDRASWSRASWSRASWSRASWSCDCEVAVTGDEPEYVETDPTRASWSRASWSRASWSRASWSRASWSRASWSASFDK